MEEKIKEIIEEMSTEDKIALWNDIVTQQIEWMIGFILWKSLMRL